MLWGSPDHRKDKDNVVLITASLRHQISLYKVKERESAWMQKVLKY